MLTLYISSPQGCQEMPFHCKIFKMELGIVGLPNVGKSSLFNALTKAGAQSSNFPFTTIEPNVGIVDVPDDRLEFLTKLYKSEKTVHASIKFVDIAGLVKGASKGEGLGNKFLSNIRSVDAIVEVVRFFTDPNVAHVHGTVDPQNDIETINTELILSDLEQAEKIKTQLEGQVKKREKDAAVKLTNIEKALGLFNDNKTLRKSPELAKELKEFQFLSAKPLMYVANVDDENTNTKAIEEAANKENAVFVAVSVKTELEVVDLSDDEQEEYRNELGLKSGLDEIIKAGYELLGLITFLTAGQKESRAWAVSKGSTAPQAAGKIHTDFEQGFIRAQVFSFKDIRELGGEKAIKEAGKLRSEGKDYIVQDGDVVEFLFNV